MHIFPNDKRYIGITRNAPESRWRNGTGYANQILMNRAIKKYGWANIEHVIVACDLTKSDAENLERQLILELKTRDITCGYNIDCGGTSTGKHSAETRKKISENRKGKCLGESNRLYGVDMSGELNPFYGKKHTKTTLEKMSKPRPNMSGSKNPYAKRVECGDKKFGSLKECADYYNVHKNTISGYLTGARKIPKKFIDLNLQYAEGKC